MIEPEGTYLITGGTGGLGLAAAEYLVARGARHLVLVSRRGPTAAGATTIAAMERAGAHIRLMQADVGDRAAMTGVFATIGAEMPPLRGVIHAAGILENGRLATQDWEHFQRVFPSKAAGAWFLHECTQGMDLDFFILFSSAASLLGNHTQANHAAANTFLNELASYRRHLGLSATSIDWGVWDEVGIIASRADVLEQMERQGMSGLHTEQGIDVLERVLGAKPARIAALHCDWPRYHAQLPTPDPFFAELLPGPRSLADVSQPRHAPAILRRLQQTPPERRKAILTEMVQELLQGTLHVNGAHMLDPAEPLMNQGLDSLMAVQFRTELGEAIQQSLPISFVFNYPTVHAMVDHLLESLSLQEIPTAAPEPPEDAVPLATTDAEPSVTASAQDVLAEIERLLSTGHQN